MEALSGRVIFLVETGGTLARLRILLEVDGTIIHGKIWGLGDGVS